MTLVELDHVSRSYGGTAALRDASLQLRLGVIGLVGNNGAGKSTLIKLILGLLKPDSGRVTVLGCDVATGALELRGKLGYMSESSAAIPLLRGAEYVTLSGDLYGMPHAQARRRAHEVLNYVGLDELRYRRLDEYSTGNLQRLKLAAALVHDPELLLLDEPTNGLDPAGRRAMLQLLRDLIAETGKSVILCTHLLTDVERLCNQVVVLHRGQVIQAGEMSALARAVENRFTLRFSHDGQAWIDALTQQGVQVERAASRATSENDAATNDQATEIQATVPPGWPTARFFQLAQRHGVVIEHLAPEEENLERLFLRLTSER
jgi:ABC-2 type transport system ATP-binding protein